MALNTTLPTLEVPLQEVDFRGDYPAIPLPWSARSAAVNALIQGQTHYAPVAGIPDLRMFLSEFFTEMGIHVAAEQILVTGGEQESRFLTLQGVAPLDTLSILSARGDRQARYLALFNAVHENTRIAIPSVVHPGVGLALNVRKRRVATMPASPAENWLPDLRGIKKALEEGSNLIYLESPSRLTGFCYSKEQAKEIGALLELYDALCIWDQTTAFAVPGEYPSLAAIAVDRTFAFGSLWPGMGLASWQIGYVVAPQKLAEALIALKQVLSICTGTLVQWAATGLAQEFTREHDNLVAKMESARREILSSASGDRRVIAGEAVNVLALNLGAEAAAKAQASLAERGIHVADGATFGAPGLLRVTIKPGAETTHLITMLLEGAQP